MVQTCWNVLKPHMHTWNTYSVLYFYQTRDRSLGMLVSNSLTKSWLVNLIDRPWCVKMPTQNLLRLLLLLMLVMRIVLASVCSRLGSWGLVIKLNFLSDFEHKVWSGFCSCFPKFHLWNTLLSVAVNSVKVNKSFHWTHISLWWRWVKKGKLESTCTHSFQL